jgi:transcriptional antiterminator RfaH
MALNWYVMRSKPNREEFLEGQLISRDVEVYYPRIRVKPVNPRSRKHKPYFPGYLFLRIDLEHNSVTNLERIPGVVRLVSFGGEVSTVPNAIVQAIRVKVDEINSSGGQKSPGLSAGTVVKIEHGPFEGYEGIVDARVPGKERVRVLLKMLQDRKIPVELPVEDVVVSKKQGSSSH